MELRTTKLEISQLLVTMSVVGVILPRWKVSVCLCEDVGQE